MGDKRYGNRCQEDRQCLAYGDEPVPEDFAATLKRLREERKWTVAALAKKVPCSTSHVSRMENRKGFASRETAQVLDNVLEAGGRLLARYRTQCPYPGMQHFRPAQSEWFLGREDATRCLIAGLAERLVVGRPLVVMAPSGAGKSSLLRAGLLGQVLKGAVPGCDARRTALLTPTARPLAELAAAIASLTGCEVVGGDLNGCTNLLSPAPNGQADSAVPTTYLLVIDQFEEVFQPDVTEEDRRVFIHVLCRIAQQKRAHVAIGVRADFYSHCLKYTDFAACIGERHFPLGPMNKEELHRAIEEPARRAGRRIDPVLTELLIRELSVVGCGEEGAAAYQPGALPLLSHALRAAWEKEREDAAEAAKDITIADYQETGGVAGAVRRTAEEVYHQLPDEHHRRIARQLFVRLVHFSTDTDGTRRRVTWQRLLRQLPGTAEQGRTVLDAFCDARLLTMDSTVRPGAAIPQQRTRDDAESTIEVAHEALLSAWTELADWIYAEREDEGEFRRLAQAADAWKQDEQHPDDQLLVGYRLSRAQELLERRPAEASDLHREFVRASVARRKSVTRRRRVLLRSLTTLAVLTLVLVVVIWQTTRNAEQRQAFLDAERLAEQSQALAQAVWPDDAARLAVASYDRARTSNSLSALLSTQSHRMLGRLYADAPGYAVAYSPDDRELMVGTSKGLAGWSLVNRRVLRPLPSLGGGAVHAVTYSHRGTYVAAGDAKGTVGLYSAADHRLLARFPGHPGNVTSLSFNRDDTLLASGDGKGCVRVWDVAHREERGTLLPVAGGDHSDVWSLAFSPAAQVLAIAQEGHPVRLLDPLSGQQLHSFGDKDRSFRSVDFSKDGATLGAAAFGGQNGRDPVGWIWNVDTGEEHQLAGHTDSLLALAFSSGNGLVATGGQDNTARLWDSATGTPVAVLAGHAGNVTGLAFSHGGKQLATVSEDRTVGLWDTAGSGSAAIPLHPTQLKAVAVQPHGSLLATAGTDGTVSLWERRYLTLRRTLRMGQAEVASVAFSPDGAKIAAADKGGGVTIWDAASGKQQLLRRQPPGTKSPISSLAWSPDGRSIATGDDLGQVVLWDPDDRTDPRKLVKEQADAVRAVAFVPKTNQVAEGGQLNETHIRDGRSGDVRRTFRGHTDSVFAIAFSSNGRLMATAGRDETLRLWDSRAGNPTSVLVGHGAALKSVAFSPDDKSLLTASSDGTVRMWKLTDGAWQGSAVLGGSIGTVWGAVFDPDDPKVIYSVGDDSTLRRWDTEAAPVRQHICSALGHGSQERWNQIEVPVSVPMPCRGSKY